MMAGEGVAPPAGEGLGEGEGGPSGEGDGDREGPSAAGAVCGGLPPSTGDGSGGEPF